MPRLDSNLASELSAFADGELDAVSANRLQQEVENNPVARQALHQHEQLRTASRRVVNRRTPPVSESLRARLQSMSPPPAVPASLPTLRLAPTWEVKIGRLAAAAACVIVAFLAGIWSQRQAPSPVSNPSIADVIPASLVSHAEEVHGVCSRLALGLHSGGYPAEVAALAPAVERDLHSDHPYPDLSSIGYRYRGAGPCGWPLPDAAHLLYRSIRPGTINAVSVFVQPWHEQYPVEAERVYTVSVAQSPFPMLVWRSDHVVYFLIADNTRVEQAALRLVRVLPTTQK